MSGITIGLAVTAVLLFMITFWYAESAARDPDAIEAPVFFLSVGLLLLAGLMIPVSIGVWRFETNQQERRGYNDS